MESIYTEELINKVLEDVLEFPKIENDQEYTLDQILEEISDNPKIMLTKEIIDNLQMIKGKNIDFSFLKEDLIDNKKTEKKEST